MKHIIGLLYLTTASVGLYWSIYLTLTGLYGVPFSSWYVVLFAGAVLLLIGAVLWWTSKSEWARWLPIAGSACLAAYFVPAVIVLLYQRRLDPIRVLIAILILACLVTAIRERHATSAGELLQR
jgi:hypothetical protein